MAEADWAQDLDDSDDALQIDDKENDPIQQDNEPIQNNDDTDEARGDGEGGRTHRKRTIIGFAQTGRD